MMTEMSDGDPRWGGFPDHSDAEAAGEPRVKRARPTTAPKLAQQLAQRRADKPEEEEQFGWEAELPSELMADHLRLPRAWGTQLQHFGRCVFQAMLFVLDVATALRALGQLCVALVTVTGPRCTKTCRFVIHSSSGEVRLCGRRCCRPASHRANLPHCCSDHGHPHIGEGPAQQAVWRHAQRWGCL